MANFNWTNIVLLQNTESQSAPTTTEHSLFQQTNNKTILVVDDEENLCDILAIYLEDAGYETITANSGREALAILKSEPVDAIVSDIRMPNGNGIELLNQLKESDGHPPVIFVTGFADLTPSEAFHEGAEEILAKPIDYDALLGIIRRTLLPLDQQWKREFVRVEVKRLRVELSVEGLDKKETGRITNISTGGLFVHLPELPPIGTTLHFQIHFKGEEQPGTGAGIVRWQQLQNLSPKLPRGIGVEFTGLDQQTREQIQRLTDNLETCSLISSH